MFFFLRYFLRFRLISREIVAGSTFRIFAISFCFTLSSRSACNLSLSAWVRGRYDLLLFFGMNSFSPKKIALQNGISARGLMTLPRGHRGNLFLNRRLHHEESGVSFPSRTAPNQESHTAGHGNA